MTMFYITIILLLLLPLIYLKSFNRQMRKLEKMRQHKSDALAIGK